MGTITSDHSQSTSSNGNYNAAVCLYDVALVAHIRTMD
jgi:hypothetical protein